MNSTVLITGGAGFIGSHLTDRLLKLGCKVVAIDDLSTGSAENIRGNHGNPDFEFIEGSILDAKLIERAAQRCDCIYHLAAAVGVKLIADDPVHTIETNITGTQIVLEAANKHKKKILLASSSEIYGKNEKTPFAEDDNIVLGSTTLSRWAYGASKAIDEFLALAFGRQFGLGVIIARFFNTIGPRQAGQYGMVVPRFIEWASRNEPVQIYGSGKQSRCFCYIGDVVEATIELMNCPAAAGKVFNVGSSQEITIEQLADRIISLTKSKSKKQFISYEQAYGRQIEDMQRRVPHLERIKSTIGWQPETSLDEALKITIENYER